MYMEVEKHGAYGLWYVGDGWEMEVEKQIGLTRRQSALVGKPSYLESAFLGSGKPLEIIAGFCTVI